MTDPGFAQRLNAREFDGQLGPGFMAEFEHLPTERADVREFIDRMVRFMHSAGIRGTDLSQLQGEVLGSLLGRILPGAWQGRVPPITLKGRHAKIDTYFGNNRYLGKLESGRMLDLGCGFPPETTLDSADALPGWTIHGSDPSMPAFMVHDADGSYATFDTERGMVYCQPSVPTVENWNELLADYDATAARFRTILDTADPTIVGTAQAVEHGQVLIDPKLSFERPGLSFGVGGIGEVDLTDLDAVRFFNVMFYFDDAFRQRALAWLGTRVRDGGIVLVGGDWALTTECHYALYQRDGDDLVPREFVFSLDNVLPMGLVPFFALHDDDHDMAKLSGLIRTLRDDAEFMGDFYETTNALRAEYDVCPLGDDGYYGGIDPDRDPVDLWVSVGEIADRLSEELAAAAVGVLQRSGHDARVNSIGMIGVAL